MKYENERQVSRPSSSVRLVLRYLGMLPLDHTVAASILGAGVVHLTRKSGMTACHSRERRRRCHELVTDVGDAHGGLYLL